jgi:hypothetical protein
MNLDEPRADLLDRLRSRWIYLLIPGILGIVIFGALLYVNRAEPPPSTSGGSADQVDPLPAARSSLSKATDGATCRNAIQQINLFLSQNPKRKPPPLAAADRAFLIENFLGNPPDPEIKEVDSGAFTLLDAYHLEECFLFRDAALALDVGGLPPTDQAEAAFRWAMRQVEVRNSAALAASPADVTPPVFVLRRGYGTAQERGLVFLTLLRQLGLNGCFIASPAKEGPGNLAWACGVLVEDKGAEADPPQGHILLFDHHLGVPIPGVGGKGVATLAQVRDQPALLKALTVREEFPYDVTPEQVASAEVQLVLPLSAMSRRMELMQKELLGPSVKVNLTADPHAEVEQFTRAAKRKDGKDSPVVVAKALAGVAQRFFTPEDGGTDAPLDFDLSKLHGYVGATPDVSGTHLTRKRLFEMELTPWNTWLRLPSAIRDLPWSAPLGHQPRIWFGLPFARFYLEPRKPRDLMLRGRQEEAVQLLVAQRDTLRNYKERLAQAVNQGLYEDLANWRKSAVNAYADLVRAEKPKGLGGEEKLSVPEARARVEAVWKDGEGALTVLIDGFIADPLGAETTYFLAVAMHEQAAQLQNRLDRDRRAGHAVSAADEEAGKKAWVNALDWWKRCLADDAMSSARHSAARRWQAEALAALGDNAAAVAIFEDLTDLAPLEKTARLYRAKQLKP